MKKILTSLLVLSMLVCCLSISAFAGNHRAEFTADNATGKAGDTVTINVNIKNNQGISAGIIILTCDELEITKAKQGNWAVDEDGDKIGAYESNPAIGKYDWYASREVAADGVYCVYTATIKAGTAPGEYPITIVAEDLAGVDDNGTPEDTTDDKVVSYKDGEWDATQTYEATLTVEGEPVPQPQPTELKITKGPEDVTVKEDESASFTVEAEGDGLTYQWMKKSGDDFEKIEGAASATYTIEKAAKADAGEYKVVVTDKYDNTVEATAKLTVNEKEITPVEDPKPVIKDQPIDTEAKEGDKATLTVVAEGDELTYQWQKLVDGEWVDIEGATDASYEATEAGTYRVVITNKYGKSVFSDEVDVTITKDETPPVVKKELKITTEPKDTKVTEGEKATFTVAAEGEKVTYQWQKYDGKEWKDIEGATDASYVIEKTTISDNGYYYRVIVKDEDGKTVTSKNAKLTVEKKADTTTKPVDKDKDKDKTAKTGDSTNLYIYMALCMFAAAVIVGVSYELKKNRE